MSQTSDFKGHTPTWCPGCGDWAIRLAIQNSFKAMGLEPWDAFIVFGIGCSGNMNDFLNAYAMHSLHGRAIPNAVGMKLANHKRKIVVIAGDGDTYGEGGNHFLHVCRGNHDMTIIIHDNGVYGLTTGQVAPTSNKGMKSKSTPSGIIETPVNPLTLAITQGATFVAQAFAGDLSHTTEIVKQAFEHKGLSIVNILQPCVTFNKINTYHYYLKNTYRLDKAHSPSDYTQAVIKASELNNEKFPLGVIYNITKPTFHDQLPQLGQHTLVEKTRYSDFASLIEEFV